MKRFSLVVLMGVLLFGCNNKKDSNESLAFLWLASHNYKIFTSLNLDSVGSVSSSNQSYSKSSSSSMMSMSALSPRLSSSVVSGEILYITGKKDGIKVMLEVRNIDDNDVVRTVLFNNGSGVVNTPPSATPTAFEKDGKKYILFYIPFASASNFNTFYLYEYESETEQTVQFKVSNAWNFSGVTSFIQSKQIPHLHNQPTALAVSIDYNVVRSTLYFSLYENVKTSTNGPAEGDTKGTNMPEIYGYGYVQKVFYQSVFDGTSFGAPTIVGGQISIYDSSHFIDGLTHSVSDFPYELLGIPQMIRMHTTKDGAKAYFTVTFPPYKNEDTCGGSNSCGPDANTDDPYFWPEPNCYANGYDINNIGSIIYSADIAVDGSMNNIQRLPSNVNGAGMNLVTDVSDDGSRIYVAKMDMYNSDHQFILGGPNNIIGYLCLRDIYDIPEWNGRVEIYQKNGSAWDNVGTIKQN